MNGSSLLRAGAPALALLAVAAIASSCSDSLGQLCPAGSQQAGVFNTSLTFNGNDPQQCYYSTDGGPLDASLSATGGADAGPDTFSAAICTGLDVDGGPLVYFALPSYVRVATLGGTFDFVTNSVVTGTACTCDIVVNETIAGQLSPLNPGETLALSADGGLPPISGFTGTVVDQVVVSDAGPDAGQGCTCNLPCDLQYTLTGASF
jgi:hypothetical protein